MNRRELLTLLAKFRVYVPQRCGGGFWEAWIFDTPATMRAAIASPSFPGGARRYPRALGICRALERLSPRGGYRPVPRGRRGLVLLSLCSCGVGVVSHEFTHAAHYELAHHQGREPLRLRDDERLAFLQGELVRRFWLGFYRRFRQTENGRRWRLR